MDLNDKQKQELVVEVQAILEADPDLDYLMADLVVAIGAENMDKAVAVLGGEKPHFPEDPWSRLAHLVRDHKMREACGPGHEKNYKQLAISFSGFMGLGPISEHRAREIVDKDKRQAGRAREATQPVKAVPEVYESIRGFSQAHGVSMREVLTETWLWMLEQHGDDVESMLAKKYGTQLQMVVNE